MRFSLVIPTLNRPKEVEDFMKGLERQTFRDFEVILVDQSGEDIYNDVVEKYGKKWPVKHLRCDVRKTRVACNLGARNSTGEIIAFPDDDCIYEPDTLARVDQHFRENPNLGFVTGAVLNLNGAPTAMGRWLAKSQMLTRATIWTGLIEFNFFMKRSFFEAVDGFDEQLGVGCIYGSCEGPDLALRLMQKGAVGYHDQALLVRHMDKPITTNTARAYGYAMGMGYAMRKNHASPATVLTFFIRPLGGVCFSVLRGRPGLAGYYWQTLRGRVQSYFAPAAIKAARQNS